MAVASDSTRVLASPSIASVAFTSKFADELGPLLIDHYAETNPLPGATLSPNWAFYQRSYDLGILRIFTARHQGKLIAQTANKLFAG